MTPPLLTDLNRVSQVSGWNGRRAPPNRERRSQSDDPNSTPVDAWRVRCERAQHPFSRTRRSDVFRRRLTIQQPPRRCCISEPKQGSANSSTQVSPGSTWPRRPGRGSAPSAGSVCASAVRACAIAGGTHIAPLTNLCSTRGGSLPAPTRSVRVHSKRSQRIITVTTWGNGRPTLPVSEMRLTNHWPLPSQAFSALPCGSSTNRRSSA
jgi:hypothetical protein